MIIPSNPDAPMVSSAASSAHVSWPPSQPVEDHGEVIVKIDRAFGLIPVFRVPSGDRRYLLIRHQKGHWAFPKGHKEAGESDLQAAYREVAEETGITAYELVEGVKFVEHYQFVKGHTAIDKTVTYFLAWVQPTPQGKPPAVQIQPEEIAAFRWCSAAEAKNLITFPSCRQVVDECEGLLGD
jgi:bis(5'-nucleosidyl)-tetraphosphatase